MTTPIAGAPSPAPPNLRSLARALLATAAEVEQAEVRIKQFLIACALRGDTQAVADIARRWLSEPPSAIAESLPKTP